MKKVTHINTPEGKVKLTFSTVKKEKLPPLWMRRLVIIAFSLLAFAAYLGYVTEKKNNVDFSFSDFFKGLKVMWNLK